ncbi:MAG: hypothetical protein IJL97_02670, partial [Lachnospiraceae bacterium]|nr:hypothetical protein [Lachnospiraceae bacterium]
AALDTGETFNISRLGRDTEVFFESLTGNAVKTVSAWNLAHRVLEQTIGERLGEKKASYDAFGELPAKRIFGLFAADDEAFWFAAIGKDRAALELVTPEDSAIYLYRFDTGEEHFIKMLRHAAEAVRKFRKLIYIPDEELVKEPLYIMAADRSRHVRFLRNAFAGRIIHTGDWESRLKDFFR